MSNRNVRKGIYKHTGQVTGGRGKLTREDIVKTFHSFKKGMKEIILVKY